jgi:hypothetical protein
VLGGAQWQREWGPCLAVAVATTTWRVPSTTSLMASI